MSEEINRRELIKKSLLGSAAAAALQINSSKAAAQGKPISPAAIKVQPNSKDTLPTGQIGKLRVSRMLLGGNLLTHYTHSRDLQYVYNLTANYNTEDKIHQTMALAEAHGINTLSIHNPPGIIPMLKRYRYRYGGKMQWIVCPTAAVEPGMEASTEQAKNLVGNGRDT